MSKHLIKTVVSLGQTSCKATVKDLVLSPQCMEANIGFKKCGLIGGVKSVESPMKEHGTPASALLFGTTAVR